MSYHYQYNRTLLVFSRKNKNEQTEAEKRLWFYIRNRQLNGYKFRRQYPVQNYILDFYCVEERLAIELDGSQHVIRKVYDDKRTKELGKLGIQIIRFWDNEVLQDTNKVLEKILSALESFSFEKPHPDPLLKGEGNKGVFINKGKGKF